MAKFQKKQVTIQDWLATRPYKAPLASDLYYLKVAKGTYQILETEREWFVRTFENEEGAEDMLKKLSVFLTCYFEDYAVEGGIWRGFTELHSQRFGRYLPFYNLEDYDPDYFNLQDIQYLFWHFISKLDGSSFYGPDHSIMTSLSESLLDYFEDELENALVSDTIEKLLTVEDGIDWYAFRDKLEWFSTKHSFLSMDFLSERILESVQIFQQLTDTELAKMAMYDFQQKFYCNQHSSFMALTASEWFAQIAHCSEQMRAQIR
ncbi:MAG: DUF3843 family protein, partial [Spirosomaceae bacterium]|nr:DUF3843 family protein [Spirosomataceae bacterium]